MKPEQFAERIGNIDDSLITQAEQAPNYGRRRRNMRINTAAAVAAAIVLMFSSFTVGAMAFSREVTVEVEVPVEVPVEQEIIVMEDIGISLILPDHWKDKYVAEVDGSWCNVYVRSIYDYCMEHEDYHDENGPCAGILFSVTRAWDEPMTPEEFYDWAPWPAVFLMSTEEGAYCLGRPSDVEWLPQMEQEYKTMENEIADIQLVLNGVMRGAIDHNGYN